MKTILKWIAQLNLWYENLKEPNRFIVAVLYGLFPFMILSGFAAASKEVIMYILAFLWMIVFVIAPRAWWLYGNLKDYLLYKR